MRDLVFNVVKTIGNIFSHYLLMVLLVLIAMLNLFQYKGIINIPDNIKGVLEQTTLFTKDNFMFVIYIALIAMLLTYVLSDTKGYIKAVSIITIITYLVTATTLYDFCINLLGSKLKASGSFESGFLCIVVYCMMFAILELIGCILKWNTLKVGTQIKHLKVDDLIVKYLHEEDIFNMDLCNELMKKYGGMSNE